MKRILIILSLLMLIITIMNINSTYSKYYTEVNGEYTREIGQWKIKINTQEIYSEDGQKVTFTMSPILEEKENVKEGKIAPGTKINSDIDIDPTGTDVAVRYDIKLNCEELQDVPMEVSIEEKNSGRELVKTDVDTYTGVIPLSDIQSGKIDKITITLTWTNDEANNESDTQEGTIYGNSVNIPVEVTATQYLGEEITLYTE